MPDLSNKKIKFIKNNRDTLSIREMARRLGISKSDVRSALENLKNPDGTDENSVYIKLIYFFSCSLLLISPLLFYTHIQNFSNLPKATFIQLISCLLLIFWLAEIHSTGRFRIFLHPLLIVILLWLSWSGITIIWSIDRLSGITIWLHWSACFICMFILVNSLKSLSHWDNLIRFSVVSAVIVSIIGILQFTLGFDIIPQGAVPGSTFSNKNIAVQFVIIIWPFSLLLVFLNKQKNLDWIYSFFHSFIIIYLLYTRTRAGWIAVLISFLFIASFLFTTDIRKELKSCVSFRKILCFSISILFILGMSQVPQKTEKSKGEVKGYIESLTSFSAIDEGQSKPTTTLVRIAMWKNTLSIIHDYPLTGVGLGAWHMYYPLYQDAVQKDPIFSNKEQPGSPHNEPLQIMTETGILGLLSYSAIFILFFVKAIINFRATKDTGIKLRMIFISGAILSFFINSVFTFPLRMTIPPLYIMVSFGMFISLELHSINKVAAKSKTLKSYQSGVFLITSIFFLPALFIFNSLLILGDYHYLRSSYFNRVKNWQTARIEAKKAIGYMPWRHKLWFELGKAGDHLGLDDEALYAYKNALNVHPNHMNTLLNLGHIYMKKNDFNSAIKPTMRALSIKPDFDLALYNMGVINDKIGKKQEAVSYYLKAIESNPKYAEAYFLTGLIYLNDKKLNEAKEYFERAVELKPDIPGVNFNLGNIYSNLNMPEMAMASYQKEIDNNPSNAEAYSNMGLLLSQKKRWEEAIHFYKKALDANPRLGAAHINISAAYYMLKEYDFSWKHCRIAEKLGMIQARDMIRALKKVSKEPE